MSVVGTPYGSARIQFLLNTTSAALPNWDQRTSESECLVLSHTGMRWACGPRGGGLAIQLQTTFSSHDHLQSYCQQTCSQGKVLRLFPLKQDHLPRQQSFPAQSPSLLTAAGTLTYFIFNKQLIYSYLTINHASSSNENIDRHCVISYIDRYTHGRYVCEYKAYK